MEVTKILAPTSCSLISTKNLPMQVPPKTIRSRSDYHNKPNKRGTSASTNTILMQIVLNFNSRTLNYCQFHKMKELREEFRIIVNSLIILIEFESSQL